jgi:Flp pilus assembly protein TadB
MGEVFGAVLAALVVVSLVAIGLYLIVGITVSVSTLLSAHRDRRMAEELDQVLEEVLGPRTPETSSLPRTSPPVRRD